eukprot:SAG11_NODE_5608_length_1510_cov_1.308292_2_plen_404_part_00
MLAKRNPTFIDAMLVTSMIAAAAAIDGGLPSVCIMVPTNGRPEFVAHALAMIEKQDYPRLPMAVVVVDDSAPGLQAQPQAHSDRIEVQYLRPMQQMAVGAKRNLAAATCRADVVVHWDDDDFFGPRRLLEQLGPIARNEADVTVFEHKFTYFLQKDEAFAVNNVVVPSWGPHFGTLVWRRALFAKQQVRFPNTSRAEDYGFAQDAVRAGAKLALVDSDSDGGGAKHFVCVRHTQNTWVWSDRDYRERFWWNAKPLKPAVLLSEEDFAFARGVRASGVLKQLEQRRKQAPSPKYEMDASIDPNFFSHLYYGGEASARSLLRAADYPGAHNRSLETIKYDDQTYDLQTELIWSGAARRHLRGTSGGQPDERPGSGLLHDAARQGRSAHQRLPSEHQRLCHARSGG